MWGLIVIIAIVAIYLYFISKEANKALLIQANREVEIPPAKDLGEGKTQELQALVKPSGSVAGLFNNTPLTEPVINHPEYIFQIGKTGAYKRSHQIYYHSPDSAIRTLFLTNYGLLSMDSNKTIDYTNLQIMYWDPVDSRSYYVELAKNAQHFRVLGHPNKELIRTTTKLHFLDVVNATQEINLVKISDPQPVLPAVKWPEPPPKIHPDGTYEFMLHGFKNARSGSFKFIAPDGSIKQVFLAQGPKLVVSDEKNTRIESENVFSIKTPKPITDNLGQKLTKPVPGWNEIYTIKYDQNANPRLFNVCCSPQMVNKAPFKTNVLRYFAPGVAKPVGVSIQLKNKPTKKPELNSWK